MKNIVFLCALIAIAAAADPSMVDMLFKPAHSRSLQNRQVVGVNSYLMRTNIRYSHPELQPWLNARGVQALRWPAGTPANYHDWESGKALQPPISKRVKLYTRRKTSLVVVLHLIKRCLHGIVNWRRAKVGVVTPTTALLTADALANLRDQFRNKDIWVTEWHVGGFSDEFRNLVLGDTWLGGLYAAQVFLKFLLEPSVKLTSLHSLTKTIFIPTKGGAGTIAENYLSDAIKTVPSNGTPLDVFGPIVKKCSSVTRLIFRGASRYRGLSEYPGLYSEVSGAVFQCGTTRGWAVVVNTRATEYLLTKLSLNTFGNHEIKLNSGFVLNPNDLKSDAVVRRNIPSSELSAGAVPLAPFSIAVFRLSQ